MLIIEKYNKKINGTITCYDRIVIQGVFPNWSYAEVMTGYFHTNNVKIGVFQKRYVFVDMDCKRKKGSTYKNEISGGKIEATKKPAKASF